MLPLIFLAGCLIGLWRGESYSHELEPYSYMIGKTVLVNGTIADDPDEGKNGEQVLRLRDIRIGSHSVGGTLWVSTAATAELQRSDSVVVEGRLSDGFGSFSASLYRADLKKAGRPAPGDVAVGVRNWFAGGVHTALPDTEASLGVGFVVGQKRALPPDLDKALRAAGLTHIVVASGYNLTILIEVTRRIFARISKYLAAFSGGILIVGFVAVAGMSPSMSRAALVTGLSLLAWYYGRRFHPIVLLALAAAITLLINPAYGWNDLGWQLSFASFAGVLIVGPLLQRYFFGDDKPGLIRQVLGETMSAWLSTAPLIALAFGQVSNVAILANLIVLPLIPLAMLLTFIAGMGALLVPSAATIIGFPAYLILGYMTQAAEFLGGLSWAQTSLTISPIVLIVYYVALICFCCYIWWRIRFNPLASG